MLCTCLSANSNLDYKIKLQFYNLESMLVRRIKQVLFFIILKYIILNGSVELNYSKYYNFSSNLGPTGSNELKSLKPKCKTKHS